MFAGQEQVVAYDEGLAERIRGLLEERSDVSEKRMFGGIAFMVRGHMAVGVVKDDLMVRVGREAYDALVREPHARRMDFTGRPMKGFVYVASVGLEKDASLQRWVERGVSYAAALPAKTAAGLRVPVNKRMPLAKSTMGKRRGPRSGSAV